MSAESEEAGVIECPDCGVGEGHLHELGCDMESCPFCGEQLISCDCVYEKLELFDRHKYDESTSFLPPETYTGGLTEEQESRWEEILAKEGRLPWISYPNVCARCGCVSPELFMVNDAAWEHYIEPRERHQVICRNCFELIRELTDKYSGRNKVDVVYRELPGRPSLSALIDKAREFES